MEIVIRIDGNKKVGARFIEPAKDGLDKSNPYKKSP